MGAAVAWLLLVSGSAALADSASSTLSVGVTVTRSCVVTTNPQDPGFANLRLTCSPGTSASVRLSDSSQTTTLESGRQNLRVPTFPDGSTPQDTAARVVTLNF